MPGQARAAWQATPSEAAMSSDDVFPHFAPPEPPMLSEDVGACADADSMLLQGLDKGDVEAVRTALDGGASVKELRWLATTPLGFAASRGHVAVVQLLLERGADVNATPSLIIDDDFGIPLHEAAYHGHLEVVRLLLERGADVNGCVDVDRDGDEDSYGGPTSTPLHAAAYGGHLEIAQLLLERGAALDVKEDMDRTPLCCAAWSGRLEVARLLLERGADVGTKNKDGETPLHIAIMCNNLDVARLLLEHGADAHPPNNDGETPLHLVARKGDAVCTRMLLERGAGAGAKDKAGNTPLHHAANEGHLEVAQLLIEHGAEPDPHNNDGDTPLYWASEKGHLGIIVLLLERGANTNVKDKVGNTPLHYAALNNLLEAARLLLEHGADANAKTNVGTTPLHSAAMYGHLEVALLLVERGADLNNKNMEDKTPLDKAKNDAMRAVLRAAAATKASAKAVPPDVSALLTQLSLSSYGPALCDKLGVTCVKDLRLATDAMLKDELPAMKPLERAKLLNATSKLLGSDSRRLAAIAAPPAPPPAPQHAVARVRALVVGVDAYGPPLSALANPVRDAGALSAALRRLPGAHVTELHNPGRAQLLRALRDFSDEGGAPAADDACTSSHVLGLFFFSGHGLQVNGVNYLVPSDFRLPASRPRLDDVEDGCVKLDDALRKMQFGTFFVTAVALDCCRNVPNFLPDAHKSVGGGGGGGLGRGLAVVAACPAARSDTGGMLLAFATAAGDVALDASSRVPQNSPFTAALLSFFEPAASDAASQPPPSLLSLTTHLVSEVRDDTRGQQVPYTNMSLSREAGELRLWGA